MKWDEASGKATAVVYTADGTTAPVGVVVTKDMRLEDPWDIAAARLVKKPAEYKLIDFFSQGTGPHKALAAGGAASLGELCKEVENNLSAPQPVQVSLGRGPVGARLAGLGGASSGRAAPSEQLRVAQAAAAASSKRRRTAAL